MDDHPCGGTCGTLESLHELARKKVHLASFGCTYNLATTPRFRDVILAQGYTIVPETDADVVIVTTCTVVGRTERQVLARLRSIMAKELIVMGCMVPTPRHHDERCGRGDTDC